MKTKLEKELLEVLENLLSHCYGQVFEDNTKVNKIICKAEELIKKNNNG